ncbi:MAG: type II secretion system F family protein [Sporichthyaceae bacterium]
MFVTGVLFLLSAVIVSGAVRRERRIGASRRAHTAQASRVAEFVTDLAAQLRAGRPARVALVSATQAATGAPWQVQLAAVGRGDGDVAGALVAMARTPGAADLRDVAACWRVAERSGTGLATGLSTACEAAAERAAHAARVRAELAGVRVTAWMLAGLPVLGLGLGALVGASPLALLLGSPAGAGLLTLGVTLDVAGVIWLRAMARRVEDAW